MLNLKSRLRSKTIVAIMGISCSIIITLIYRSTSASFSSNKINQAESYSNNSFQVTPGYLVWSPQCKIADYDPFAKEKMSKYKAKVFKPCSTQKSLTSIEQNFEENVVRLIFHANQMSDYLSNSSSQLMCWYNEIIRDNETAKPDKKYKLMKNQYFNESIDIPSPIESIIVKCRVSYKSKSYTKKKTKTLYKNAHTFIRRTPERAKVSDKFKILYPQKKPLSVLMIGIDSISRLNFLRAMPNTAKYVHQNDWFELEGYNKNGYRTYPNLMAILTGISFIEHYEPYRDCKLDFEGYEKCPFLWKYFEQIGYATAYAEDDQKIQTFNYCKDGFAPQPTTHYLRSFGLAAEDLGGDHGKCLLYQHYADYVYQNAIDFATAYKDDPFFGLFWTNSFSHDDVYEPASMDDRIKYYLEQMDEKGILNSSAVIFFSDHGMRYGETRMTSEIGWLEESLPFMFIWLPKWFKDEHPDFVESLKVNRNRLTTTFDIHMTLKHILELSGRVGTLDPSQGCEKCQTLFREVPWNRSCDDAGIQVNYCACSDYKPSNKSNEDLAKYTTFILKFINNHVAEKMREINSTTWRCADLTLKSIDTVSCSESSNHLGKYLIKFETMPSKAVFEAVIQEKDDQSFELIGSVSRLNQYGRKGDCVDSAYLRNYCFCQKLKVK